MDWGVVWVTGKDGTHEGDADSSRERVGSEEREERPTENSVSLISPREGADVPTGFCNSAWEGSEEKAGGGRRECQRRCDLERSSTDQGTGMRASPMVEGEFGGEIFAEPFTDKTRIAFDEVSSWCGSASDWYRREGGMSKFKVWANSAPAPSWEEDEIARLVERVGDAE